MLILIPNCVHVLTCSNRVVLVGMSAPSQHDTFPPLRQAVIFHQAANIDYYKWFILIKSLVHVFVRHDLITFFSVHVNSEFGISNQQRFRLD